MLSIGFGVVEWSNDIGNNSYYIDEAMHELYFCFLFQKVISASSFMSKNRKISEGSGSKNKGPGHAWALKVRPRMSPSINFGLRPMIGHQINKIKLLDFQALS